MDAIETETKLEPDVETAGQGNEGLIPIKDYAERFGVSRRTVERYAKVGRIEIKKQLGRIYVVDNPPKPAPPSTESVRLDEMSDLTPLVQKDWFDFGMAQAQAQAKAKTKWQIACLAFAVLLVAAVITGSGGGVWLWKDRVAKANALTAVRRQLTDGAEQINALQGQLATERQDYATRLASQQAGYAAKINVLTAAETQLATAAEQFNTLQDQLAIDRQDYITQLDSQRASYAGTVEQLQDGIAELAGHVVELSKAVAEVQLIP